VVLKSVSDFSGVYNLDLSECRNITDDSAPGNVHALNLNDTNVDDVPALKNVYELHLEGFVEPSLVGLENDEKLFLNC
jgi:hypothetical protein